ncbi:hypothetical protein [Pseudomonas phage PhL_UNISO_PA-DSM_ph0041x]|nr:hypothetical protein [Pseudomonas phage PhL_UNISO_PA-DSM_ph0041x]
MERGNGYLVPTDEAMVTPGRNPHRTYGRRLGSLGKSTKETIP